MWFSAFHEYHIFLWLHENAECIFIKSQRRGAKRTLHHQRLRNIQAVHPLEFRCLQRNQGQPVRQEGPVSFRAFALAFHVFNDKILQFRINNFLICLLQFFFTAVSILCITSPALNTSATPVAHRLASSSTEAGRDACFNTHCYT